MSTPPAPSPLGRPHEAETATEAAVLHIVLLPVPRWRERCIDLLLRLVMVRKT